MATDPKSSTATPKAATVQTRQMEVYQLTLNTDGTVDSALRLPTDATGMAGGAGERVRYNALADAPALGQKMDVTYTPVVTV